MLAILSWVIDILLSEELDVLRDDGYCLLSKKVLIRHEFIASLLFLFLKMWLSRRHEGLFLSPRLQSGKDQPGLQQFESGLYDSDLTSFFDLCSG